LATISAFTISRASPPQTVATSSQSASAYGFGSALCGMDGPVTTLDNVPFLFFSQLPVAGQIEKYPK
jgi:hypothetical protein